MIAIIFFFEDICLIPRKFGINFLLLSLSASWNWCCELGQRHLNFNPRIHIKGEGANQFCKVSRKSSSYSRSLIEQNGNMNKAKEMKCYSTGSRVRCSRAARHGETWAGKMGAWVSGWLGSRLHQLCERL